MEQLTRKERYEARQKEKLKAKEAQQQVKKRDALFFALAILVPLALIGGLITYSIMSGQKNIAKIPDVGQRFPIQSRDHIAIGAAHPPYNSNPPTGGWHYATPANWGVYTSQLPEEQLVHNLEHGGIVVQYKLSLDKAIIAKLEDLKKSGFECKLVVAPYSNMDKNIALTAWGRLYASDTFDETTIKNFIQKYRETGPESVPCDAPAAPMQQATTK